jgi:2'-5' RNA ligase
LRLFVAFDLPAQAKAVIGQAIDSVRGRVPRARWVRPENLHLTLAFLGEADADQQSRACQHLRERLDQAGGFSGHLGSFGAFPPAGKVRVLWLGIEPAADFEALASRVRDALRDAAAPLDEKRFRAHVTIARCDPPWAAPLRATIAEQLHPFAALLSRTAIGCDRVTLYSSTLGSGGPTYRVEEEFLLRSFAATTGGAA